MIFDLMAEGFWSSLLLGTRRLLDKGPINGPKGVYSIRSVINDVKSCRPWIDRRTYVELLSGARYELDILQQERLDNLHAAQGRPIWGSPELALSEEAHRRFDILSDVAAPQRDAGDLIDPSIFKSFEDRLSELDVISDHVSSHIAHAGNKESRQSKGLDEFDIRDAHTALKKLKEVAALAGLFFADKGCEGLPTCLYDQFEGLDQPLVETADLADLQEQWLLLESEIAGWSINPKML